MAENGNRLVQVFLLLTLRTMKATMSVIYVLSGYQLTKLQLTMLLQEAESQVYDTYSPTWPSLVARVMEPKGHERLPSSHRKKKK